MLTKDVDDVCVMKMYTHNSKAYNINNIKEGIMLKGLVCKIYRAVHCLTSPVHFLSVHFE